MKPNAHNISNGDECNMQHPLQPHDTPDATLAFQPLPLPLHPAASPLAHLTRPDVTHTIVSGVTDRAELIERIKAGETPTWVPNRNVRSLLRGGDGGGDGGGGGCGARQLRGAIVKGNANWPLLERVALRPLLSQSHAEQLPASDR